ncbi:MAG: N-6 DNA methylase [Elusimicrobiales bacterium]|nr:N-6 DNA methylase [Elusimicrobiales bacterium]
MSSERITEDLTLKEMNITLGKNDNCYVYEQGNINNISKIEALLKKAGGKPKICELNDFSNGGNGKAQPEFIITFDNDRNTIIVIECKKSINRHISEKLNQPKDYAVDGVLYYSKFLKSDYNVIAIAVSGTNKNNLKISTFDWRKNQNLPQEIIKGKDVLYTPENYLRLIKGENVKKALSMQEIREMALMMHDYLRDLKVSEKSQPVFIAGILIALKDKDFSLEYSSANSFNSLHNRLITAINTVLNESDIRKEKIQDIKHHFEMIGKNGKIKTIPLEENQSLLWFISELDKKIKPMMDYADVTVDALGIFYHEFVKYSGGDGKGLGIVLTPQHLTEFMCELAQINKNSKVVDICCGSAAFLVTAMSKMFVNANQLDIDKIKKDALYGVEFDDDIYTLSIANMIVRGDGKSNIIYGDCFDERTIKELKEKNINIGLINPPYSQKDHCELEFVNNLLNILTVGGIGVAVVPMSCAIGTKFKAERELLFKEHTLKAVFSMPDDMFYSHDANTNVCVMVWEAHKPHDYTSNTYFGYYKNDGFVKAKKLGRIDKFNKWHQIKKEWIKNYENKIVKSGVSCLKSVKHSDEWLAESYMETDYDNLSDRDFIQGIKNFCIYKFQNNLINKLTDKPYNTQPFKEKSCWNYFKVDDILEIINGKGITQEEINIVENGTIPCIQGGDTNNGILGYFSEEQIQDKDYKYIDELSITLSRVGSAGAVNLHPRCFIGDKAKSLILKKRYKEHKNPFIYLYLKTVLSKNKYRFAYGRGVVSDTYKQIKIKLPINEDNSINWNYMEEYIKSLPYSSNL